MAANKGVVITSDYTFAPGVAGVGTITFSANYTGIALSDIMYITNVKSTIATVIYDPFNSSLGGVLAGLVLTLAVDTSSMSSGDALQIIVGMSTLGEALPTNAAQEAGGNLAALVTALNTLTATINSDNEQKVSLEDVYAMFKRVTQLLERPNFTNALNELKIINGSTALAVTAAVSTITTLTNQGSMAVDQSFGLAIQNRILFNDYKSRIIT